MAERRRIAWPWMMVAALSAIAVIVGSALLLTSDGSPRAGPPSTPDAGSACALPPWDLRPLPLAPRPPFRLLVEEGTRLRVDEMAIAPSSDLRLTPGPRSFEILSDEKSVSRSVIEVRDFEPVLLHVLDHDELGVLALRLGGACRDCIAPLAPVTLPEDNPQRLIAPLLRDAATALRRDDWASAARNLRSIPKPLRLDLFHRLAAMTFSAARMPESALTHAELAARTDPTLQAGLTWWITTRRSEMARRDQVRTERWNILTERFARLLQQYDPIAPGAAEQTSQRLEALGVAIKEATDAQDSARAEEILESALLSVAQWLRQVQSNRPLDCDFQRQLWKAATGLD